MKKDEKNGSTGRTIFTRSVSTSTSATIEQETPGLRRSNREAPSKKPITPVSSTRKSERLAPSPSSVTKKSGKTEKRNAATTLPSSDNGNNGSKGSDKSGRNAVDTSSDVQMKDKKENSLQESTNEINKRKPKMTGRAYRALFRGQLKKSEALENQLGKEDIGTNHVDYINTDGNCPKDSAETFAHEASPEQAASPLCHLIHQKSQMKEVNPSSNEEELVVVGCSRRVPAGNDDVRDGNTDCPPHANSESKSLSVGETSLEKDTDFPSKIIRDTEKVVLDASPMVETGGDSIIGSPSENPETQKLPVSITSLENDIDLPLKRKRDTEGIVLDALAKVANGDEPFMSSNGVMPSPSGCKNSNQPETCSTCGKRQKVNGEFEDLRVCPCIAQPVQESDHVAQGMKETEPAMSRDCGENMKSMQQDKSYDPKSYSSIYPEYWVPVQLSDVQLEQYCRTLLAKSVSLSSLSKKDLGSLEETLTSVRKICDHPYVAEASLKQLLTKNLELHEILDVEIKASGKLYLLDAMLTQIKENGLKAVIFYQTMQSPEGLLLGNILEDFVSQRFGPKSYEHGILTSKKNAVNNFNKESQCFVLLLEKRACSQSIKLLRADAFILFGSNLNPSLDVKLLEKIKIESSSERTKIFRLYSTFTFEEKALILARQNKEQNKPVENLNRPLMHALLMWGASYLFDKLNHFHGSEIQDSGVPFEQAIMEGVIHEFSSILSSKGGEKNEDKLCLLSYSTDSTLFGEEHVKLSDESSPNIFWTKLLGGKNPKWKYCSGTPQRNRKRVQYFPDSEDSAKIGNGGNTKKRKKASDDVTNPLADTNERKASGKDHMGALESPVVIALQSSCRSASGTNGTLNGNDACGLYSVGGHISGIPEDMLAGKDWRQIPHESQRSLHAVLKSEMAKLGKILHLSEDWTSMVEKFLEYVIENHRVCEEPATMLQAFQIALIWIAALLVKQEPKKKESLVLAKSELAFSCSREEVDYIFSLLYCMKSLFLERTQGDTVRQEKNNTKSMRSSGGEECMTEKRGSHYSSATKDIKKAISDIKKTCKKREQKLEQKHEEEKVELVNMNAKKKQELETKKKLEAALIRITCSRTSTQTVVDGLKQLDHDYERKLDEITSEMDECLKRLEQMHEAAKKKLAEDEACWVSRIENWAQAELIHRVRVESGNNKHSSGICSSNTPKNAPDVQTCNGEATHTVTNCMVSKGNQVPEAENILGTMLGSSTQQVHEMVTSINDKAMDVSTLPREQPTDNVATKSQSNEHASVTVPEILIPAGCQEEFAAVNVHLSENPICDRMTLPAPDEDASSKVPEISQPFANLAKSASPEFSLNREEALVTKENNRTSLVGSDADYILDQQNEEACSFDKEIPDKLGLPMPEPASMVETRSSAESDQDDLGICPMPSSPVVIQPDTAANIQGQNIEAAIEPQPAGSETVETGGFAASEQGDQVACPLPASPAGNQPEPENIEGQNTITSAEPHIAGPDAVEIGDSAVSDEETMGSQDACALPSSLVETPSDLAGNTEGQNITTVVQLHTAGSDAVETTGSPVSDQVAQDASPLPNEVVNIEGINNTTVAEPHTTCEMEIAESGPQVEQAAVTANNLVQLVNEGSGVEPSAPVVNNSTAQQAVPHVPFPVFNDPFQHELEKLRRESENTKKSYEEKKSNLKAELERKMAEVQAEYQRKFHEVEVEHKARVMEIETNRNLVSMNKLLASAFMSKCTDKNASQPSAATRGRIQQLAQVAAQMNALRDCIALPPAPAPASAPAPALAPAPAPTPAPVQPQASSSYPRPMPQPRPLVISNTVPSPSVSPATNPVVRRTPPPHLRSSASISIATTTTPTSSSLPPQASTYSTPVLIQQQQQELRQQQNLSSGLDDVVCLSDDE